MIVTADGRTVEAAYLNAWCVDHRMEGVRIAMRHDGGKAVVAEVHPDDVDACLRWRREEVEWTLREAVSLVERGDAEMVDDRGVDAWLI